MSDLALFGGTPAISGQLPRYNSIGAPEVGVVGDAVAGYPLSGFLGGNLRGGQWVQRLEELWAAKFKVRHAIACNSATSGLLAACAAANVTYGSQVITTPFTMSATSAAPRFLGAKLAYGDVDRENFNLAEFRGNFRRTKATVITNLFGHPAHLEAARKLADHHNHILIEDNAQSILAMENGRYAGTIGHLGVFSLNVHKHIQAGEGGVVCTDDDQLADRVRKFINHGELSDGGTFPRVGLNLRMTEYTAAIAVAQLSRLDQIVDGRVKQAEAIVKAMNVEWLSPPNVRKGCTHVYYNVPFLFDWRKATIKRDRFVAAMAAEGVPLVAGYVDPLYRMAAFDTYATPCPVAEDLHDRTLLYFSNCEYSPTQEQIAQIGDAVKKIEANLNALR